MSAASFSNIAEVYNEICSINPPVFVGSGTLEFGDLALVRTVNPLQHDYLAALARVNDAWKRVQRAVAEQREIRLSVYNYIKDLNSQFEKSPSDYVFPDAYSLLLWIWTYQLFNNVYISGYGKKWNKYFYRGESKDYGATRFSPSITRLNASPTLMKWEVPLRLLRAIQQCVSEKLAMSSMSDPSLHHFLIETMSSSQAIAVAQHYGFPTPLLDVTVNPEIAAYFATLSSEGRIGIVGFMDASCQEERKNLALVMASSIFSRIQRQGGYFITLPPGKDIGKMFTMLRFYHQHHLEPIIPRWIGSLGFTKPDGTDFSELLFEDPYGLESHLKLELPEPRQPKPLHQLMVSTVEAISELEKSVISELYFASVRHGVIESGKRFMEVHPELLYSIFRYAPIYGFVQAMALKATAEVYGGSFKVLSDLVINLQGKVISNAIYMELEEIIGQDPQLDLNLNPQDIMTFWGDMVKHGDTRILPWPLSAWYK